MDLITYQMIIFVLQARPSFITAMYHNLLTVSQAQSNGVSPAPLRRTKGVLKKLIERQP